MQESNNNLPLSTIQTNICNSDMYHETTKELFNCEKPTVQYDGEIMNTGGFIVKKSPVESAWLKYKNGDYSEQLKKVLSENARKAQEQTRNIGGQK